MSGIIAYTDGGCRGNPGGPGAWAFLLVHEGTGAALERWAAEPETTNNRMELTAAIRVLEALTRPGQQVEIRSDSKYLIESASTWIPGWKKRGWIKADKQPVKNLDLVKRLDELLGQHRVRWTWVKGHSGDPGNDHVDARLNAAMDALAAGQASSGELRHERSPIR